MSKFAFIAAEKASLPVTMMCRLLDAPKSGFYAMRKRRLSARVARDQRLANESIAVHAAGRGCYGTCRVVQELRAACWRAGHERVSRIRRQHRLVVYRKRRFRATTNLNHGKPICSNVLARSFNVEKPNTAWCHRCRLRLDGTMEGWQYLAAVLDLCLRGVVGWATGASNDSTLAIDGLRRACGSRKPKAGWIHHTDRGSVYVGGECRSELRRRGGLPCMSGKGNWRDNAVAERLFASIKGECVD